VGCSVAIKPFWERVALVGEKPHDPNIKLIVEMGLTGYELVMLVGDERIVLAKPSWGQRAKTLQGLITEGLEALKQAR
jgi:hypothetical protein